MGIFSTSFNGVGNSFDEMKRYVRYKSSLVGSDCWSHEILTEYRLQLLGGGVHNVRSFIGERCHTNFPRRRKTLTDMCNIDGFNTTQYVLVKISLTPK